jgi:hypothetical protein
MKFKPLTVLLVFLLILPLFLNYNLTSKAATPITSPSFFLGVDVAYESVSATEQLIDNVSSYTNLFIIGCTGSYNLTRLSIISQYVYDKGLSFIVYSDFPNYPSSQWLSDAKNNWGNHFLGIYYYDEPGGKQLDQANITAVRIATNYTDAANKYVQTVNRYLFNEPFSITRNFAYPTEFPLFTSDYALYWYDYQAGYDTVFAEFALNYDRPLNLDLVRGAATAQNKDWGVMITWKYTQPPYMESGSELYNDMRLAYENGAKYIIVFDSNKDWTQNVLVQSQLDAIKEFWQYTQTNPRTDNPVSDRIAYVLPDDYAYGFRGPEDKIWGLWPADNLTVDISMSVKTLMQICGKNLDIVYPDGLQTVQSLGYKSIIYWNDTRLIPNVPTTQYPNPILPSTTPHRTQQDTSLLPYWTMIYIGVIVASILVAVAVLNSILKFRKRNE